MQIILPIFVYLLFSGLVFAQLDVEVDHKTANRDSLNEYSNELKKSAEIGSTNAPNHGEFKTTPSFQNLPTGFAIIASVKSRIECDG